MLQGAARGRRAPMLHDMAALALLHQYGDSLRPGVGEGGGRAALREAERKKAAEDESDMSWPGHTPPAKQVESSAPPEEGVRKSMPALGFSCEWAFPDEYLPQAVLAAFAADQAKHAVGSREWQAIVNTYAECHTVQKAAHDIRHFLEIRLRELKATEISIAVELSTHSETPGRFHAHCVFSWIKSMASGQGYMTKSKQAFASLMPWSFFGKLPQIRANAAKGRHAVVSMQRAHAYLQVRKTGTLYQWSNFQKGVEFVCPAKWVMHWWQLNKLTAENAKAEILANRDGIERSVAQISYWEDAVTEAMYREEQRVLKLRLASTFSQFKSFPIVLDFIRQHSVEAYARRARFQFLVVVGESNTGKTQFALSLYGPDRTYYTNVQNADEPNLKDFSRRQHRAIVFDEATPAFVVSNKVVFQANADGVRVQESRCQQYSTWRFLYAVPMIVCTNAFDLSTVSPSEARWLRMNMLLLNVGSNPTFVA